MEIGKWGAAARTLRFSLANFLFPISVFLLASCGSPGDPRPPEPPVPAAITDLTVRQSGESVVLTFTLPQTTVEGEPLETRPDVEIFRAFVPRSAPAGEKVSAALLYTVPGGLIETYLRNGRVVFDDPLRAEDLARHAGEQALYTVRARASKRRASADSNTAAVRVYPVPEMIFDLTASVTATSIELRWTPPARTSSGTAVTVSGFRIYRGERRPEDKDESSVAVELLGISPSAGYRDEKFEFGRTYVYSVRSVAQYELDAVESADSKRVHLTPQDTFAPAPPQNLVAIPSVDVVETPERKISASVDLSWSISPETDVTGYHVYRMETGAPGAKPARLNRELLLSPAFRDISVSAGRSYIYTVSAVDRSGNESAPSAPVSVTVNSGAQEKQQEPK